jgi:predicted N-acetyltransferase YhbS
MSDFVVRVLTHEELPAVNVLRFLAGWNQTEQDWHGLLDLEPKGCFVAVQNQDIIGSVTTTSYGDTMAWIGMMLVHPDHRRQGIGRCLMRRATEHLESRKTGSIRLDATPAGMPLYLQLGFLSEWTLTRWRRPETKQARPRTGSLAETRSLKPSDWPVVEELDAAAFGLCRATLLRSLARNSRNILVWPGRGLSAGWGMLRPGSNSEYLGPIACASPEGARGLVEDLTAEVHSSVIWDIPDENEAAKEIALSLGFEPVRQLTRMCLRHKTQTRPNRSLVAIADPAVG